MTTIHHPLTQRPLLIERVLGTYSQGRTGPTLLLLVGIHGNEPSGVIAAQTLLATLREKEPEFHGRLAVLVANLPALEAQQRFLDVDLNRIWLAEKIEAARRSDSQPTSEMGQLWELLDSIEEHRSQPGQTFFLDCHSTSSESVPYISCVQHAESLELAGEFPVFTVIGAAKKQAGVSDHYLLNQGFRGFTFEAGQHDRLSTLENQQAMMWLMLDRIGCLVETQPGWQAVLGKSQLDGQRFFEVNYVHSLDPGTNFRMRPGFFNFQRVREGDLLAWQDEQPVTACSDGRIYLPLYQPTGDEGFSIITEVH